MRSGCSAERGKAHGKRQEVRWISAACLREGGNVCGLLAGHRVDCHATVRVVVAGRAVGGGW